MVSAVMATSSRPVPAPSLLVRADRAATLRADSAGWPDLVLDEAQVRDLSLIGMGVLRPLRSFMDAATAATVASTGRLPDGTAFPAPVVLRTTAAVPVGADVALRDAEGDLLAALHVTDVVDEGGQQVLAGGLEMVQLPERYDLPELWRTPAAFAVQIGARTVVVTDRPLDAGQLAAAGPAPHVLAVAGDDGPGIADPIALARSLQAADVASVTLVPRPPGGTLQQWAPFLAAAYGARLQPVDDDAVISDGELAAALAAGQVPGPPVLTQPVQQALQAQFPPLDRVGLTVLFSGLSGSGKSTVARALAARLRAIGPRRVTLLDGDLVRTHLSSELGFSREHRDLNVARIGFVAGEVTRHGGIAICAPIAPYASTRSRVRAMIEPLGRFVLVHVATPLEVCEARDRKGLYAKARAGLIPEFTGISDPYETPMDAEVVIDTSTGTPSQAAAEVEDWLRAQGLIR